MKKRLLLSAVAALTALSSFAIEAGEYVYAPFGRFKVTGTTNLFGGTIGSGFSGFESVGTSEITTDFASGTDEEAGILYLQAPASLDKANGMSYKLPLSAGKGYVVSVKMKANNGLLATHNTLCDHGTSLNKVSVFSTSGAYTDELDTVFSEPVAVTGEWTTYNIGIPQVDATKSYYLDFVGLSSDLLVGDIQVKEATQVADKRQRDYYLSLAQAYHDAIPDYDSMAEDFGLEETMYYLQNMTDDATQAYLDDKVTTLKNVLVNFRSGLMDDFFAAEPNSKLPEGGRDDNKSTLGYFKVITRGMRGIRESSSVYHTSYRYLGGYSGSQTSLWNGVAGIEYSDSIKYLPGTYIFSLDASANVTESTNSKCYDSNPAYKFNAVMYALAWNDATQMRDTIATTGYYKIGVANATPGQELYHNGTYNPEQMTSNFLVLNLEKETYVRFGFKTLGYPYEGVSGGGKVVVKEANLYGYTTSDYTDEQLRYIASVQEQIQAGTDNVAEANANLTDAEKPWGKSALQECLDVVAPKVTAWEAYKTDTVYIVDTYNKFFEEGGTKWIDDCTKEEGIMAYTVYSDIKDLVAANKRFKTVNDSLALLPSAIEAAEDLMKERTYTGSTEKAQLEQAIANAKSAYATLKAGDYSEENRAEIDQQIAALNAAKSTYMNGITTTTLVDIDFSNKINEEAPVTNGTVTVNGAKGVMTISNFNTANPATDTSKDANSNPYQLGIQVNGVDTLANVLRVGNGDATVDFDPGEVGTNILKLSMDFWFGRLSGCNLGFFLLDEEGQNVSGLRFSPYDWSSSLETDATNNPLGVKGWDKNTVGFAANTDGDAAFVKDANKTSMTLYLDYGTKKAKLVSVIKAGEYSTDWVDFNGNVVKSFKLNSDYNYAHGRRSWFDNLKIEMIPADDPTAVSEVKAADAQAKAAAKKVVNGQLVIETAKGTFNAAGAQVK